MRFLVLDAKAFGPFRNHTVEFAPGLNVFFGPNESGKSSLHAALYTGFCGVRRGKGRTNADLVFEKRHRPWDGDGWAVGVLLVLEDGRKIEIRQDLDGKADSQALDVDFGRDCTSEIVFEGSPDGSRWLGLDRRAFLATACMRQAELLDLRDDPRLLQEYLQRAAGTKRCDATAGAALARIETFQREQVGSNRLHGTKPLRRAHERLETARRNLDETTAEHEKYLSELSHEDELEGRLVYAERELRILRAAREAAELERHRARFERVRHLLQRYPETRPKAAVGSIRAAHVSSAWGDAERITAASVLEHVPPSPEKMPGSNTDANEIIDKAEARFRASRLALETHAGAKPRSPENLIVSGASAFELRQLAAKLSEPEPETDTSLEGERERLEAQVHSLSKMRSVRRFGSVLGVLGVGVSILGLVLGSWPLWPGLIATGLGLGLFLVPAMRLGAQRETLGSIRQALRQVESRVANTQLRRQAWEAGLGEAQRTAQRYGLEPDPVLLESQAAQLDQANRVQLYLSVWQETQDDLENELVEAKSELRSLLLVHGIEEHDLNRGLEAYKKERTKTVQERAELANLLEDKSLRDLEEELASREARARELAHGFSTQEVEHQTARAGRDVEWARRKDEVRKVQGELERLRGALRARQAGMRAVPEAEEELLAAQDEMDRVKQLDDVLNRTRQFLSQAQAQVHRDIAPILAGEVRGSLSQVTGGRYTDVAVDPETLEVRVRGVDTPWREAAFLSQGTREQVYLLFRVAMAKHLTREGEVSPLILDDVTVQSDGQRTRGILDTLQTASRERQIVLLTQEEEVLAWAQASLQEPQDRLVRLDLPQA